jgi:hypothetical protein
MAAHGVLSLPHATPRQATNIVTPTMPLTCSPLPPPAGYQYRRTYQAFLDNFWQLLPAVRQSASPADKRTAALLRAAGISDFKLGTTKVFLRWVWGGWLEDVVLRLPACLPACLVQ